MGIWHWSVFPRFQLVSVPCSLYRLSQPDLVVAQQATTTSAEPRNRTKSKVPESKVNYDGTFFSGVGTPRLETFTVHPEWVSERRTYARQSQRAQQRTNTFENIYGRRSRSAPALRSRNPITWEWHKAQSPSPGQTPPWESIDDLPGSRLAGWPQTDSQVCIWRSMNI